MTFASMALSLVMALVYAMLGTVVGRHRVAGPAQHAVLAFAAWWFGLGLVHAVGVLKTSLWLGDMWSLPAYLAYLHLYLLVVLAALGCLVYYMLYLFTGRSRAWVPVAVGYALYYAAIVAWLAAARPDGLADGRSGVELTYANDLRGHWTTSLLTLLLLVPPLVAAMAYLLLIFGVEGRSQRFRIGAVSGAFIFWFGTLLTVSRVTDWSGTDAWNVASSLIALGAAWLVYIAFRPPRWLRRRFGLSGYAEPRR